MTVVLTRLNYVVDVVVQFYPWFKFYFTFLLGKVMYDNEFKTKQNKIKTKDILNHNIGMYLKYKIDKKYKIVAFSLLAA